MTPEMIEAMMPLLSKQERKEADRLILMLLADERPRCHPIDTLGPGMTWREWCASYVPQAMSHPFSFAHEQMWDWTEELKRGVRPKALIAAINRRGGKTTTARAMVSRICVRATRSFALYVCRTQKDADRHVGSIGRRMEQMGVKRQMSVHGFAVGWNASMLRTENGFTILAFGLADAASRGVNLDDQRPDIICHEAGTQIYDMGRWMAVEDHPTASRKICDGLSVRVHGLPYPEVVTTEHRYWTKQFMARGKESAQEWTDANKLTESHFIGLPIDNTIEGMQPVTKYVPGEIRERNAIGQVVSAGGTYIEDIPYHFSDPEWWWIFGAWWGNGHIHGKHQIAITIADKNIHTYDKLVSILGRYKIAHCIARGNGCYTVIFSCARLNRWLDSWRSGNAMKQPPLWVEKIDTVYQRELIRGYLETDGFVDTKDGGVRLTSVHLPGLYCVRRILLRLGIASTIRSGIDGGRITICGVECNSRKKYDLRFQEGGEDYGARPLKGRFAFRRVFIRDGFLWSKIKSVDTATDREFVPITTKNHEYLTAFGKSHNCFDDIDVLGETLYMIDKKKDVMAATVIPSGSNDCAFIFVQNPIHANSIMSQVLDGRFDVLMNRITIGPVPALLDMEWQYYIDEENRQRARIVSGIPTWEGLSLQTCQDEIDAEGVGVFLREFQHDVYRVGVFFTNWDKARHVRRPGMPEGPCRICGGLPGRIETCRECGATGMHYPAPWPIPSWWKLVGGLDYGRSSKNPFAFVLFAIDDNDNYYAVDEIYQAQLSPEEQAEKIIALLKPYGRPLRDVPIWCGPEIFPGKEPAVPVMGAACGGKVLTPGWSMFAQNGEHVSDIYIKAGLNVVPAVGANTANERVNGWAAVNKMLDKIEGFIAYEGRVPNLIRTFPVLPVSPNNPEDVDSSSDDHIADGCRYVARNRIAVAARPIGSRVSGSQAYIAAALEKRRKELSQKRKW